MDIQKFYFKVYLILFSMNVWGWWRNTAANLPEVASTTLKTALHLGFTFYSKKFRSLKHKIICSPKVSW
jgi:hypothetical protein